MNIAETFESLLPSTELFDLYTSEGFSLENPCFESIISEQSYILVELLEAGLDPNTESLEGNSLLYLSACYGDRNLFRALYKHGSFSEDEMIEALHFAVVNGGKSYLRDMIATDINLNLLYKDSKGLNVLEVAVHHDELDCVKLLISEGDFTEVKVKSLAPRIRYILKKSGIRIVII